MIIARVSAAATLLWIATAANAAPDYVSYDSVLQRMDLGAAREAISGWSGLTFTSCNNCTYIDVSNIEVTQDGIIRLTHQGANPSWVKLGALAI